MASRLRPTAIRTMRLGRSYLSLTRCFTEHKKRPASPGPLVSICIVCMTVSASIPGECAAGLILDNPCFEKVLLLLQVDHLRHPWERVVGLVEERVDADLLAAAVGDEAQVFLEHG